MICIFCWLKGRQTVARRWRIHTSLSGGRLLRPKCWLKLSVIFILGGGRSHSTCAQKTNCCYAAVGANWHNWRGKQRAGQSVEWHRLLCSWRSQLKALFVCLFFFFLGQRSAKRLSHSPSFLCVLSRANLTPVDEADSDSGYESDSDLAADSAQAWQAGRQTGNAPTVLREQADRQTAGQRGEGHPGKPSQVDMFEAHVELFSDSPR